MLISIPVGRYLAAVVTERKTLLDRLFDPIDNFIYLLIGRRICRQAMDWKAYTLHMLATNLVMALIIFLILVFQDHLPLNPQHFAGMEPLLAFNTAISFITNTDWQAYGGETTLSNFSQMAAITFPMFTSATTGFVVAMAFIRAFTVKDGGADLGNFYRDLIRFTTRVLMPASFVLALLHDLARRAADPRRRASPPTRCKARIRRSRSVRWPRSRPSSTWAPMAAASSMPMPRIPSKIRRRSPTSC